MTVRDKFSKNYQFKKIFSFLKKKKIFIKSVGLHSIHLGNGVTLISYANFWKIAIIILRLI